MFSTCRVLLNVAVIFDKVDIEGLFNEMKFKQRLERGERMSHADIWRRKVLGKKDCSAKVLQWECALIFLTNSKEPGVNCNGIYKREGGRRLA